jgi:hypothetical protein
MKTSTRRAMAIATKKTKKPKVTIKALHSLMLAGVNDLRLVTNRFNALRKIRPI